MVASNGLTTYGNTHTTHSAIYWELYLQWPLRQRDPPATWRPRRQQQQ